MNLLKKITKGDLMDFVIGGALVLFGIIVGASIVLAAQKKTNDKD